MVRYASESRIANVDGLKCYVPTSASVPIPLYKLALRCEYRIGPMCDQLGLSPRSFRRQFSEAFGICPKRWLKAERMVFARNLLRSGLPIKDVSSRLGFTSQKDFAREFQEHYQMPPTAFRSREQQRALAILR